MCKYQLKDRNNYHFLMRKCGIIVGSTAVKSMVELPCGVMAIQYSMTDGGASCNALEKLPKLRTISGFSSSRYLVYMFDTMDTFSIEDSSRILGSFALESLVSGSFIRSNDSDSLVFNWVTQNECVQV
ncbi:c-22 sterol desaturase [Moniliophthora roreri]|nr:c-22 sterol desaturase [Moniliophthora roreri]